MTLNFSLFLSVRVGGTVSHSSSCTTLELSPWNSPAEDIHWIRVTALMLLRVMVHTVCGDHQQKKLKVIQDGEMGDHVTTSSSRIGGDAINMSFPGRTRRGKEKDFLVSHVLLSLF